MDNKIEIAANLLLSNAISIYNVGHEIHIRSPIAPYHLPQPISTFQEYLIVLKSLEACVPSMLYVPSNQVFFCGQLTVCPDSNQATIIVKEYSWTVHQGQLPNLYEYKNAHIFGKAQVLNVHWHPIREYWAMIDIVDMNQPQSGVMKLSIEHDRVLNTFQLVQPGDVISFVGMAARLPSLLRGLLSIDS
ncbi:hypothetical protein PCANC_07114 [Puccinia coronata f. sp. avenae]|uniref:Uncharacterized protein n=1 Tax=Puccinia coronata f. sp. avenae TaxID=200324 RepID=A0A2N5VIX2_9BASI|nr:hypothetical protein PCANC_07114 [Puccinia coronata f. sp. avenae]